MEREKEEAEIEEKAKVKARASQRKAKAEEITKRTTSKWTNVKTKRPPVFQLKK